MFKLTTLEIHLGGNERERLVRTPGLFLHANNSYTVGDGLLLNKWYHLTYTLSDSEKRMDIFINGVWTAMRSWILSGCVDEEIGGDEKLPEYLIVHQIEFLNQNPIEILETVNQHETFTDILPHDLIHDLLGFHIVPNKKHKTNIRSSRKKSKLDSNLVEPDRVSFFASWIDRKESESSYYEKRDILYNFKLLYRSTKIKDSTKLIEDWKNISNITTKLSCIINGGNYVVYCSNNYGPQMGGFYCKTVNNGKIMALQITSLV
ncbi:hypothetical protein RhiirA5_424631 [Rhizophagus irregularis]|uniref:TLDc domain-containing protein n=1 Tax=Rhizophagus irregularis TaxID=588596 RepID=A0A2I1EVT9_9GLOM|nr:hypothetical protein RhiirA5_424631 [Rhizophagus irregularis]PKC59333.1 hypothetical protein RhiirA1_469619 [Rhizophagus irregularis]PKY26245.1 hypothetical protein RhiirB3_528453 [Rhizophagus irregularis]